MSLFSGGGFADYALERAAEALGIEVEVVAAYDSWPVAVAVYNANLRPVGEVCDLKQLDRLPPHDLVIGGPPCQDHSLAGQRGCKCNVGGPTSPRCCLADFLRLTANSPAWLMENVRPRLVNAPWSEQFCAANFGDVTSRKRWFYSNYLLHVQPTPGPRRIRDIRDHAEDERVLAKRGAALTTGLPKSNRAVKVMPDEGFLAGLTAGSFHGTLNNGSGVRQNQLALVTHRPRTNSDGCEPYATTAPNDGFFSSLTADAPRTYKGETLKLGLRGNSASASAFEDGEHLGSILSNSWHANEASRIVGCRNPSLLEMARAHSIPDAWDWAGATKTQRGQLIANGWPIGMGTAVLLAMLHALRSQV